MCKEMDKLLDDAANKGWKVLKRYEDDDGWFTGNSIEYAVLMKGTGCLAKFAHVHLAQGCTNSHLLRQCESGGAAYWEAK